MKQALFAFGLIFLGLIVWQALQADFVVVAPEGFREGSGADIENPVVAIDFKNLRSIDFNYRESWVTPQGETWNSPSIAIPASSWSYADSTHVTFTP